MSEKNLDFDQLVDRRGTHCLKYDFAIERGKPADILPLWVADMDFPTSSYVQEALQSQIQHGIFGYSDGQEAYFEAVAGWIKKHHDYEVKSEWLIKTPGIVFAIALAVQAYTKEGDGVLIQQPVYYPFSEAITDNGRRLISSDLVLRNGRYEIDFEDFERKIVEEKVKLFLLCSPHNPVGRVWTKEELLQLGNICLKHGVKIVSDEIHSDFVFQGKHHVLPSISKDFEKIVILCNSPSKTFNLAGLQISNIFIPDEENRRLFKNRLNACGYSQPNVMGVIACDAAYRYGEEWYQHLLKYLKENIEFTQRFIRENLPKVQMTDLEGTYLVWLDFRAYGFTDQELNDRIIHKGGLWLDSGEIFGQVGSGFQRINVACPRSVLKEALEKLVIAVS